MSPPVSPQNHQALLDEWRTRLLEELAREGTGARQYGAFAKLIGLSKEQLDGRLRRRLKGAIEELRLLAEQVGKGDQAEEHPDAFDRWIDLHILMRGASLLISEEQRRGIWALQREVTRRSKNSARGLHSARIEMRTEAWKQLEALCAGQAGDAKATRSMVLEQLIDDAFEVRFPPLEKAKASGNRVATQLSQRPGPKNDLFPDLPVHVRPQRARGK